MVAQEPGVISGRSAGRYVTNILSGYQVVNGFNYQSYL